MANTSSPNILNISELCNISDSLNVPNLSGSPSTLEVRKSALDVPLSWNPKASHRERDKIEFIEDGHYYLVNGQRMNNSVTQLVHKYFNGFEAEKTARTMLARNDFLVNKRYEKYWDLVGDLVRNGNKKDATGRTFFDIAVDRVTRKWEDDGDEAAGDGTIMHKSIEKFYLTGEVSDTKEFQMFMNFHNYVTSLGYIPFRTESLVWSVKYSIAGSVDMLYIHKDDVDKEVKRGKIFDWKRTREIKTFGFGKKGIGPMSDKADCNYEHYSLQLNIYKYLLERSYNIIINRMTLVILHPNQDDYELHEVPVNKAAVREILHIVKSELETNNTA